MSEVIPPSAASASASPASRFLSAEECRALFARVAGFAQGGGETKLRVQTKWRGNLRWARNHITSAGDVRTNEVVVVRTIHGAQGTSSTDALDDRHLRWMVRRAERVEAMQHEQLAYQQAPPPFIEDYQKPTLWFDTTYSQDAAERAELMRTLVQPAVAAGLLAAGYIQVSGEGVATMSGERLWYYPFTRAEYTVTVRDPSGQASGWAGQDHCDWTKIDTAHLTQVALEKCLRSRNPKQLEPGRYTTILEPQAVHDLVQELFTLGTMSRWDADTDGPFNKVPANPRTGAPGFSKLGERVIDSRLSLSTDCMDPAVGYLPFADWTSFRSATLIQDGVLTTLPYSRDYAVAKLGQNTPLDLWSVGDFEAGFHLRGRGEPVSIEEMIATTRRGLLVTRFAGVDLAIPGGGASVLVSGYTRDGLWLIRDGQLSQAVKNFRFTESVMEMLNNVEQVGVAQRVYAPLNPYVAPALKVRDFSFTSLSDAI